MSCMAGLTGPTLNQYSPDDAFGFKYWLDVGPGSTSMLVMYNLELVRHDIFYYDGQFLWILSYCFNSYYSTMSGTIYLMLESRHFIVAFGPMSQVDSMLVDKINIYIGIFGFILPEDAPKHIL